MNGDLARERYVSLATYREDGTEVLTPVWIAPTQIGPAIYTNATSWKVKRIRNNGKVRVAPCTARGIVTGEWVHGTARIADDADARDRQLQAFITKYGWQMRLTLLLSRISGRHDDRAIIELDLPESQ